MRTRRLPPHDNPFRPLRCRDITLLFLAAIIGAYRLIPPAARRVLFRSNGSSTAALAEITAGRGAWGALWRHGHLQFCPFPSWTDPGPQGRTS
jgi:hypothetical protein